MKNSTETLLKEELDPVKGASFNVAIAAALNAAKEIAIEPTSLVSYQCKNNVLIIGDDQRVAHVISQLSASMAMTVLISSKESEVDLESIPDSISIAYGKLTSLSGYLGSFNAELTVKGQQVNLATVYNTKLNSFDLVIDLNKNPVLNQSLLPFGYFSPQNDFELEEVIRTFPDMLGEFEKPKFFEYNADICAHGNSGLKACQRCINACPAEAIISIKDLIKVNPYLCQGGGTCATVCPTGAIQYVYPRLQDTIGKVRSMLKAYYDAGGEQAAIAFYGAEESALYEQAALENYIPFQLEEIASIGMDVWLSAFAFGARDVVLLTHEHTLKEVNETLDTQLSYAHAIIEGMGFESSCLRKLLVKNNEKTTENNISKSFNAVTPGTFMALNDKRNALRMAIDHLYLFAPEPNDIINLPAGAPFGEVQVNKERCTLCMACVSVCPAKALGDGTDLPQLKFSEANCVQCGLCSNACPETALNLVAQYNFDPQLKRNQKILHEDEPFCCTKCAKPFATNAVIDNILGKLSGHSMFQSDEAIERLKMCEDCRVIDMFSDEMNVRH